MRVTNLNESLFKIVLMILQMIINKPYFRLLNKIIQL